MWIVTSWNKDDHEPISYGLYRSKNIALDVRSQMFLDLEKENFMVEMEENHNMYNQGIDYTLGIKKVKTQTDVFAWRSQAI